VKISRRFGGTCHGAFFIILILQPWRWCRHVPPNRHLISSVLRGVISHRCKNLKSGSTWNQEFCFSYMFLLIWFGVADGDARFPRVRSSAESYTEVTNSGRSNSCLSYHIRIPCSRSIWVSCYRHVSTWTSSCVAMGCKWPLGITGFSDLSIVRYYRN
jgi:hypothetical protein